MKEEIKKEIIVNYFHFDKGRGITTGLNTITQSTEKNVNNTYFLSGEHLKNLPQPTDLTHPADITFQYEKPFEESKIMKLIPVKISYKGRIVYDKNS